MASFDARTAYANDYAYRDFVVDGLLTKRRHNAEIDAEYEVKVELLDEANGEQRTYGQGLLAAPNEAVIEVHLLNATDPAPTHLDVLSFDDREWTIQRTQRSRYRYRWTVTATEGRRNV